MKKILNINGFEFEAEYSDAEVSTILIPLLEKMTALHDSKNERIVVFLAAPPAVGKTTLAVFLEKLSQEKSEFCEIQHLSLDGFHHKSNYLKEHKINYLGDDIYLNDIKGMPETFDYDKFLMYLKKLKSSNDKWPIYDRKSHDVIEEVVEITKDIVLIEGNWLLLDEERWNQLVKYCDLSIFIEANKTMLKERLVNRKLQGGLSYDAALDFYERSDKKNIQRVLKNRIKADINLSMVKNGEKMKLQK